MSIQQQAHMALVVAVAGAYDLPLDDVAQWPPPVVQVLHRKAIDNGRINQLAQGDDA